MDKTYFVYVMANQRNGTLYIGVTNDLFKRVSQHKAGVVEGFTRRHGVHLLVYYETFGDITDAIEREKRLKNWNRAWKLRLIEERNPDWLNLSDGLPP